MMHSAFYPVGDLTRFVTIDQPLRYFQSVDEPSVSLTLEESRAIVASTFTAAAARDASIFLGNTLPPNHFGPYALYELDVPLASPNKYVSFKPPRGPSNQPHWDRTKRGLTADICVSSHQTGQLELSYGNGYGDCQISGVYSEPGNASASGLFPEVTVNIDGRDYVFYQCGGYKLYDFSYYRRYRFRNCASYLGAPHRFGWDDNIAINAVSSLPFEVDSSLVTTCAADANTGTLDLLTTLAETPELVKSVLAGCTTIMRMYRDARTKNVRLLDRVAKKRIEYDEWLRLSSSEKQTARVKARNRQIAKSFEQAIKDLATAAADVWLNYRLNILPTVGAIEDGLKGIEQLKLETFFVRYRETQPTTLSLEHVVLPPGWELRRDEISVLERVLIKRGAQADQSFSAIFSTNPFKTAWELIPLSFVVDRYMSIGSLLAAGYSPGTNVLEGATFSWKVDDAMNFIHPASGASVTARLSYYKRLVINPSTYLCIPFPPKRSRDQSLDHLALAWNLVLKNLWKVK